MLGCLVEGGGIGASLQRKTITSIVPMFCKNTSLVSSILSAETARISKINRNVKYSYSELTQIQSMKSPVSSKETPIRLLRLLLSDPQINLILFGSYARTGDNQATTVSVALILAVHVHEHGKARCDVTIGGEVDAEIYFFARNSDVGRYVTVAVLGAIFVESYICAAELD